MKSWIAVGLFIFICGRNAVGDLDVQHSYPLSSNFLASLLVNITHSSHGFSLGDLTRVNSIARNNADKGNCSSDIETMMLHLDDFHTISILDSEPKVPDGVLRGNFLWMGNSRECTMQFTSDGYRSFRTHYCVATWKLKLPKSVSQSVINYQIDSTYVLLKTGLCLPKSCSQSLAEKEFKSVLPFSARLPSVKEDLSFLNLTDFTCQHRHQSFDASSICFLTFLSMLLGIVFMGSTLSVVSYIKRALKKHYSMKHPKFSNAAGDGIHIEDPTIFIEDKLVSCQHEACSCVDEAWENKTVCKVLHCFCVFTNGAKILTASASKDQLLCIHGIRVLSMLWIILGHTYIRCLPVIDNLADVGEDIETFAFQSVLHGTYVVDTFFLLSGFLLTFLYLKQAEKLQGRIYFPYVFIHRYCRLTPVYAVVIGYLATVFKYTGSGSFWGPVPDYVLCQTNWWWNLLYINNFQSINNMCADYTWYLANDMQFYILCSILLYFLSRWPKWSLTVVAAILLSSWIATWIISDRNQIEPFFYNITAMRNYVQYESKVYNSWDLIYSKPWCRIGPYLIGMFLAYIVCKTGNRRNFLLMWHQVIGWVIASFLILSVIFGLYESKLYSQVAFNFYNSLSRSSFSVGVAWVLYSCLTGHAGLVNKLLSWRLWLPLSRLTYSVYLIHPVIITWYFRNLDAPFHFSHQEVVIRYLAFVLISYGIGFLISALVESPLMALEKVFLPHRYSKM